MKVAIYSPSQNIWGGGQIYIDSLCHFLNDAGIETVIVTADLGSFSSPTIPMRSAANKTKRLLNSSAVAKELKVKGVRVVILNDLSSLWLAPVFRFFGFKVVSLLHLFLQKKNIEGFGHGWLEYHLLRFSSRFAHCILSVNKDNQSRFPGPVGFVGNFVPSWFFDDKKSDSPKYDIGLVSRLSKEKNIPLFIELVSRLNDVSQREVNAVIVGDGEEKESIKSLISKKGLDGVIKVKPWLDRKGLPGVYDGIKCFAVTSYHEGFATTVLEAHARGVPVITTSSAGFCPDFVLGGVGVTGMVFEAADILDDSFLCDVIQLINSSHEFYDRCRDKASNFREEKVLDSITSHIIPLL